MSGWVVSRGASGRTAAFDDLPDRLGVGKDVELFDFGPDMPDPGIGKACLADPRSKALAQIDMTGTGNLADRGHDLLVIYDAPPVRAGNACFGGGGQLDRNTHALRPVALGWADPNAAQQNEATHDDGVALWVALWVALRSASMN